MEPTEFYNEFNAANGFPQKMQTMDSFANSVKEDAPSDSIDSLMDEIFEDTTTEEVTNPLFDILDTSVTTEEVTVEKQAHKVESVAVQIEDDKKDYSIKNVIIQPSTASVDTSTEQFVLDLMQYNPTELENDYVGFLLNNNAQIEPKQTISQVIVDEYNKLYPYKPEQNEDTILRLFLGYHYGVCCNEKAFEILKQEPIDFIKQFDFPFREVAVNDVIALKEYGSPEAFSVVKLLSLSPINTETICKLVADNKFDQKEAANYADNNQIFNCYLQLKAKDKYDANSFDQAIEKGNVEAYTSTVLAGQMNSVTERLLTIPNSEQYRELLMNVNTTEVEPYLNYEYFGTIIKFIANGVNEPELFERYLKEKNFFGDYLDTISSAEEVKQIIANDYDVAFTILKNVQEEYKLQYNIQHFREEYSQFVNSMIQCYLTNRITEEDVITSLFILTQESEFRDFVVSHAAKPLREMIFDFIKDRLTIDLDYYAGEDCYQLRYKTNSIVFNSYEFINNSPYYVEALNTFRGASSKLSATRIQGVGYCLTFGMEAYAKASIIKHDKRTQSSLYRWLYDSNRIECSIKDVKRYNLVALQRVIPIEGIAKENYDALMDTEESKFVPFDGVLDYLNCNPEFAGILGKQTFLYYAKAFSVSINIDNETSLIFCFVGTLLTIRYKKILMVDRRFTEMPKKVPSITVIMGNKVSEYTLARFIEVYDALMPEFDKAYQIDLFYSHNSIQVMVSR